LDTTAPSAQFGLIGVASNIGFASVAVRADGGVLLLGLLYGVEVSVLFLPEVFHLFFLGVIFIILFEELGELVLLLLEGQTSLSN